MEQINGFIKLHRRMLSWGWYKDVNVKTLFLHLLLIASFRETEWRGYHIEPGTVITSYQHLSNDTGLTVWQVRNALKKLNGSGEVTTKTTNKFTAVTIVKWADYQLETENTANKPQTNRKQATNKPQTNRNILRRYKNVKNVKKVEEVAQAQSSLFETFWNAYPRKTNKEQALDEFNRLGVDDALLQKIISGINSKIKSPQWQDVNFIPYPKTFSVNREWESVEPPKQRDAWEGYPTLW